jgi:hypothetical protein
VFENHETYETKREAHLAPFQAALAKIKGTGVKSQVADRTANATAILGNEKSTPEQKALAKEFLATQTGNTER